MQRSVTSLKHKLIFFRYSKNLPLRVKACKGYYGECDSTAVTTGDMLNLHFVKNTKVIISLVFFFLLKEAVIE